MNTRGETVTYRTPFALRFFPPHLFHLLCLCLAYLASSHVGELNPTGADTHAVTDQSGMPLSFSGTSGRMSHSLSCFVFAA